jgi:ribokinase
MQLEIPPETVERAVEIAAESGTRVVLNPAPARPLADSLLRRVAVLTPNAAEAAALCDLPGARPEEAAAALLSRGAGAVLVTLGAEGVHAATADGAERFPAFAVRAEDTTAAGDVFSGALAVALAEGRTLAEAATFASAAAALSVTRRGAQPSAPRRHEILELIETHAHA